MTRQQIISELKEWYSEEEFSLLSSKSFNDISDKELYEFFNQHCDKNKEKISIFDLIKEFGDNDHKDFLINTPDGFNRVKNFWIKPKDNIYSLKLLDDFAIKCSSHHLLETIEGWKKAEDISDNDFVLTSKGYKKVRYKNKLKDKENVYDLEVISDNNRYWAGNGVSSHNCGKTYLACSICREAQQKGYKIIYIDSEAAITSEFIERLGCDPKNFIIKTVNTVNETTQFITNVCKAVNDAKAEGQDPGKIMIVLDSIGNIASDKEKDDALEGKNVADFTRTKELKKMFRIITVPLAKAEISLVAVNHTYANVGSFVGGSVMSGGSGTRYSSTVTLFLTAAKLQDKDNDKAAAKRVGAEQVKKNGVLVTAHPEKSRLSIPHYVKFQIPFFSQPNKFLGLEAYLNWENAGICQGKCLDESEYQSLKPNEQLECLKFEFNGENKYAWPKKTMSKGVGIVCKHLGRQLDIKEFFSPICFTPEFLEYIDNNIIKPEFELPTINDGIDDLLNDIELEDLNT